MVEDQGGRLLPIAPEGWPFILAALAPALLLLVLHMAWAAGAAGLVGAFMVLFFRDPDRDTPGDESLLAAPADGRVVEVRSLPEGVTKVGIFLSIFDVHVNRVPVSGDVEAVSHTPGRFLAAWKTLSSEANERSEVLIRHPRGAVRVVQVAGLVARRIICRLEPGRSVRKGDRYGLIRFGSRVDTYLPPEAEATVQAGDRVKGGESTIGRWCR